MFSPAEEIIEFFDEKEVRYRVQEQEEETRIIADVVVDYAAFSVVFLITSEENDVSVRVPHFVRFKEQEYAEMLRVANQVNDRYRFCKFTVNKEAEAVTMEYDFPENTEQIGPAAHEIFQRTMQIAEEAYPEFMRAIWGSPKNYSVDKIEFRDIEV